MSFRNRAAQIPMARCQACDGDLVVKGVKGYVYCSNDGSATGKNKCEFFIKKPHPTGPEPNGGVEP